MSLHGFHVSRHGFLRGGVGRDSVADWQPRRIGMLHTRYTGVHVVAFSIERVARVVIIGIARRHGAVYLLAVGYAEV